MRAIAYFLLQVALLSREAARGCSAIDGGGRLNFFADAAAD